jgi:hypothetical protein
MEGTALWEAVPPAIATIDLRKTAGMARSIDANSPSRTGAAARDESMPAVRFAEEGLPAGETVGVRTTAPLNGA